ncbi:MAG TPA: hypothetical protein VFU43_02445 [Streptosporangiaceae bacterium]|nr:hypothetical protein [Streptosporangiaceae bacterium]
MPILHRDQRPARPEAASAARSSRRNQTWPAVITLAAATAMATVLAGAVLLTLVSGTAWFGRLRELPAGLRRRH